MLLLLISHKHAIQRFVFLDGLNLSQRDSQPAQLPTRFRQQPPILLTDHHEYDHFLSR
jgi:hypothetical protein